MKRIATLLLALLMLVCVLPGCSSPKGSAQATATVGSNATAEPTATGTATLASTVGSADTADTSVVNLKDMYTVTDPEGVDYDTRVALYMPVLESDEHYADGCRYMFAVLYGKDKKGVYMYSVEIYETKEQAAAYMASQDNKGEVDGVAYIVRSDATFFVKMESFIPDLDTFISNMEQSGMMELD
jgi:hypothetical protein